MAHGPALGHADKGIVDGRIAVRMVLAEHVADHAGALFIGAVVRQSQLAHTEKDAAVYRLETVPDVGQRAGNDDAHCVIQVGTTHFFFDFYRLYIT